MSAFDVAADAYRSALPTLSVSAVGGLLAGVVLGGMEPQLRAVPGLLVLVPAFLAIRGSVYGSLGSRLSSALHQGLVEPAFAYDDRLASAMAAALANGIVASVVAAVLTVVALRAIGRPVASLLRLALISVLGAVGAGVALTVVVVAVVFVGYRRGLDPDALVGPATTTAGDVFGILALLAAVELTVWVA